MNFRRIKHMLLRLSPEEKLAGVGAIIVLISSFLPWFSIVFSSAEKGTTVSGFAGDLGVIGFVVFLLTAMAVTFLMAEHLGLRMPNFGFKKEQVVLFLMGESAFLLLLTIAVYTKRSFEYTNAELRFGLYAALIGAFVGAFSAFAETQKNQKKETEAFFEHPEEVKTEVDETVETTTEEPEYKEQDYLPKKEEVAVEPVQTEQKSFFYEKAPEAEIVAENEEEVVEQMEEVPLETEGEDTNPRPTDEPQEEETPEEMPTEQPNTAEPEGDAVETQHVASEDEVPEEMPVDEPETAEPQGDAEGEDTDPRPADEPQEVEPETPPLSADMDQGDYLIREAGAQTKSNIKVDIDSIKQVEKDPEKKEAETETMSFYDDL